MINVFQPLVGDEEIEAVAAVMRSGWLGKGPKVAELERVWAERVGVPAAQVVATTCASEGLFQAIGSLELDYGDEVIMPVLSFPAAANAVKLARGTLVFCDADPHTLMPTIDHIEAVRSKRTKAIVLLHYGGWAVPDSAAIAALCETSNIVLIEDAACAPATKYDGRPVGTLGNLGVWSFDAMKIITGGDGGLVYAADPWHAEQIRRRTNLGMSSESGLARSAAADGMWWPFDIYEYGRRAIMNDITAAIILEQIKKLELFVAIRKALEAGYRIELADLVAAGRLWVCPIPPKSIKSSHYFFWIQTAERDALARHLRDNGVYTTFRYYPLTRTALRMGSKNGTHHFPGADRSADTTLCLPLHQAMQPDDVERVCQLIKEFFHG